MTSHPSQVQSLVIEVRQNIPTILASMEADAYLKANVQEGEGNVVVIIVGVKLITPGFPRGLAIPDKLDQLYGLIEELALERANDHGIEILPVRQNW